MTIPGIREHRIEICMERVMEIFSPRTRGNLQGKGAMCRRTENVRGLYGGFEEG